MEENIQIGGGRRLVLGFDAGCMTCSDLAKRISERIGDKLEVRSLHHPQVEHWREQALGKNAPWAPTLFDVGGTRGVRAWTGPRMAVRLARSLGPVSTWRILQALGEVSVPSASANAMSRGQFLRGVGGGVLGIGAISVSGGLASPALAAQYEVDREGLVEAFSAIEQIPDSVMARGDKAARAWLRAKLEAEPQTRGAYACGKAILWAIVSNALPITKIKAAIRAFGGAFKLAVFIVKRYQYFRSIGYSWKYAIKRTAAAVSRRTEKSTGEKVFDALMALFDIKSVYQECF